MFNLYQIVQNAQGGQGIDNLAQQFGLTREQADGAIRSVIPALSTAFMTKAAQPGGFGEIVGAINDDGHRQAYADPNATQDPSVQQKGGSVLGSIFGNSAIVGQVAEQASHYTGIPAATIAQMLPVIASMVVGGVASAMHGQGWGGLLGQLGGMMGQGGGLGSVFGQFGGTPGGAAPQAGGGFGGMFGSILGSMFGANAPFGANPAGANPAAAGQAGAGQAGASGPAASPPGATPTGGMPPAMQAGMDALSKMFQPGVQPLPGQTLDGDLGAQISSILGGKR